MGQYYCFVLDFEFEMYSINIKIHFVTCVFKVNGGHRNLYRNFFIHII